MKVLVSGATGLIGGALTRALTARGDTVIPLTRHPEKVDGLAVGWDPPASKLEAEEVAGFDAVVHLAGESIASGRWTDAQKKRIRDSRTEGTSLLADTLAQLDVKPKTLISASAIGIYGDRGDETLEENAQPGHGFLAEVCIDWEAAAEPARKAGIRVVHPRFGLVLAKDGGALEKMLLPFKLGMGGKIGTGKQFMPWIGLPDVVGLLQFLLDQPGIHGPVNLTAPEPARNVDFTKALGKVLGRPTFVPLPAFAAKIGLGGEMAEELLLSSARVMPRVAVDAGYRFQHPDLEGCLRAVLS